MKQTNHALTFLNASYLSVLKRASVATYFASLASSAVFLSFVSPQSLHFTSHDSTRNSAKVLHTDTLETDSLAQAQLSAHSALSSHDSTSLDSANSLKQASLYQNEHSAQPSLQVPITSFGTNQLSMHQSQSAMQVMHLIQASAHTLGPVSSVLDMLRPTSAQFTIVRNLPRTAAAKAEASAAQVVSESTPSKAMVTAQDKTQLQVQPHQASLHWEPAAALPLTFSSDFSSFANEQPEDKQPFSPLNTPVLHALAPSRISLEQYSPELTEDSSLQISPAITVSDSARTSVAIYQQNDSPMLVAQAVPAVTVSAPDTTSAIDAAGSAAEKNQEVALSKPLTQAPVKAQTLVANTTVADLGESATSKAQAAATDGLQEINILTADTSARTQIKLNSIFHEKLNKPNDPQDVANTTPQGLPQATLFVGSNLRVKQPSVIFIEDLSLTTQARLASDLLITDTTSRSSSADGLHASVIKGNHLHLDPAFADEAATLFEINTDGLTGDGLTDTGTDDGFDDNVFETQFAEHQLLHAGTGYDFLSNAGSANTGFIDQNSLFASFGIGAQIASQTGLNTSDSINRRLHISPTTKAIHDYTIVSNRGTSVWFSPTYQDYSSTGFYADDMNYGADVKLYGAVAGIDYTFSNSLRIGAAVNFGQGEADGKGIASGVINEFSYYSIGLYANGYLLQNLTLGADFTYTWVESDIQAISNITGYNQVTSNTNSTALSMGTYAQYDMQFLGMNVSPHAGLRYTKLGLDNYDIKVDGQRIGQTATESADVFSIPIGVSFAHDMHFDSLTIRPYADFTLTTNFGDDDISAKLSYDNSVGSIQHHTEFMDTFTYSVDAGFMATDGNFVMGTDLGYTDSSNTSEVTVVAHARFKF